MRQTASHSTLLLDTNFIQMLLITYIPANDDGLFHFLIASLLQTQSAGEGQGSRFAEEMGAESVSS